MNEVSHDVTLPQFTQTVEYYIVIRKNKTALYAWAWDGFSGEKTTKVKRDMFSMLLAV